MATENDKKTPNPAFKNAIKQYADAAIAPEEQAMLNQPSETKVSDEDMAFLNDVISKIEKKEINLYAPSSLLNKDIYDSLEQSHVSKVDMLLHNLLASLRTIYAWHNAPGSDENFQMMQLVREVRIKKETLENEVGDVLKI